MLTSEQNIIIFQCLNKHKLPKSMVRPLINTEIWLTVVLTLFVRIPEVDDDEYRSQLGSQMPLKELLL